MDISGISNLCSESITLFNDNQGQLTKVDQSAIHIYTVETGKRGIK